MAHKIETLFKKTFGFSPDDLEPKPTRGRMITMVKRHLFGSTLDNLFDDSPSNTYSIAESGSVGGEPYTLIKRDRDRFCAYLFGVSVDRKHINMIGGLIPKSRWFDPNVSPP